MDLALALARRADADLIIANDPDADRCAVGVPRPAGDCRMLTGDEVGALLGEHVIRQTVRRGPPRGHHDRLLVPARQDRRMRTACATPRRSPASSGS